MSRRGNGHSDIGVNRDLRLPDGRIIVGCNPDGFCDRDVGVMRFDSLDGEPVGSILNYAAHPTTLGPGNKLVSPDYPGSARQIVEQVTGAPCFFLQGASGNMGPVETFVADAAVAGGWERASASKQPASFSRWTRAPSSGV